MTEWQEFRGGVNTVRRNGDVVHRPATPATPAIHRLLRHLLDNGFHGAPEPRGFDADGGSGSWPRTGRDTNESRRFACCEPPERMFNIS
ncbi:hypothetical protein ABII15_38145 [Streptomyces sp. HUAS MG91]|uniref:Uncharacterized protein n=1 Tax=Streptomyces tabacisoli TaxID=3156398 RepID=A0AAU8J4J9_9ACTN